MNNEELISQYREQLLKVHAATVAIVSCVEIAAYFVFVYLGIHKFSFNCSYLWMGVIVPICINILSHIVARAICKRKTSNYRLKNRSVIYAAIVTSFVVSLFHRDYLVTSCAFVFPIILSAMYNDEKILKNSLAASLVMLSITVLTLFFENKTDLTTYLNIVVLYGFIAVSYLSGDLSIKFSQRNFSLIEEQAIENSKLEVEIDMDQMTKLYNHEAFYERLDLIIEENKNAPVDCCLAMIDIDDFKKVNDKHGHKAGDMVLETLADILKKCCTEEDVACRYGGEEFALILRNKTLTEAEKIVESALKIFSETRFEFAKKSLTFSAGIVKLDKDQTSEMFFERADGNLYISKKNGKNRITVEE